MKKSLEEKREERLKEIAELVKQRDAINAKLNLLTGMTDSVNTKPEEAALPAGFSVSREVEALFKEHPQLRILQATALVKEKFPAYRIERRQVHSALVYLQERGKVRKGEERGLFIWKNEASP